MKHRMGGVGWRIGVGLLSDKISKRIIKNK